MEEIVNRVSKSPLKSVDLEDYLDKSERIGFDLKETLFQGLILREKDFRQFVKEHDWSQYEGKNVHIFCSVDAIIPSWSFMLLMTRLQPVVNAVVVGTEADLEKALIDEAIEKVLQEGYEDQKVVIKGCGNVTNREYAYGQFAKKMLPYVSSLMYGEPCSTVPIYKKRKK
mgnify:CR=1 FL=1